MRVAILSESSADESALRILVDALLGVKTTTVDMNLRSRGWPAVREILPTISKSLHYWTDAEGLVVVVDSNHTYLSSNEPKNRLRDFQELAQRCRQALKPVPGRVPLKIAVGVAAPAIEAWWLCKSNQQINEAAWEKGLADKHDPYSKLELKKRLYGSDYRSLELMTQKMTEAAHDVVSNLQLLENAFPSGFGSLARELRSWRTLAI
jgi:hypothetical protein